MATITIEMVDEVMDRLSYVSYKEAREALIKTDGDVLEAIILLEEDNNKPYLGKETVEGFEKKFSTETKKLREQLVELFTKSTRVRVVVEKDDRVIINMPLTVGAIGVAAMPLLAVFGLSAAMLAKYSVKIADENSDSEVEFGILTPEKAEILKEMLLSSFDDIKSTFKKEEDSEDDDDTDITAELLSECEEEEEE